MNKHQKILITISIAFIWFGLFSKPALANHGCDIEVDSYSLSYQDVLNNTVTISHPGSVDPPPLPNPAFVDKATFNGASSLTASIAADRVGHCNKLRYDIDLEYYNSDTRSWPDSVNRGGQGTETFTPQNGVNYYRVNFFVVEKGVSGRDAAWQRRYLYFFYMAVDPAQPFQATSDGIISGKITVPAYTEVLGSCTGNQCYPPDYYLLAGTDPSIRTNRSPDSQEIKIPVVFSDSTGPPLWRVSLNISNYKIPNLQPGTTYYWRLRHQGNGITAYIPGATFTTPQTFTISGNIFLDTNQNKLMDQGEYCYNGNLGPVRLTVSSPEGDYAEDTITNGCNYSLPKTYPLGSTVTIPSSSYYVPAGFFPTTDKQNVTAKNSTNLNFGIAKGLPPPLPGETLDQQQPQQTSSWNFREVAQTFVPQTTGVLNRVVLYVYDNLFFGSRDVGNLAVAILNTGSDGNPQSVLTSEESIPVVSVTKKGNLAITFTGKALLVAGQKYAIRVRLTDPNKAFLQNSYAIQLGTANNSTYPNGELLESSTVRGRKYWSKFPNADLFFGTYMRSLTPPPPTVTTKSAFSVSATGAFLLGSANPNGATTYGWFRYSSTNPGSCNDIFGLRMPPAPGYSLGSGTTALDYQTILNGLTFSTTYYFCAIASNTGGTGFGKILSFFTAFSAPPPPPAGPQATGSCGTGVAKATGLVSTLDVVNFGTTGACIVDPKAAFVPFKIPSYEDLKSLYYDQK